MQTDKDNAVQPSETAGGRRDSRRRIALWGGAALLLLLPWVAMRFTDEVAWDAGDFIAAGAMLFAACGAADLAMRRSGNPAYRAAAGVAIATALLLVWVNLAVGILGSEDNPANLMYAGVLAVGILGAAVARFRASGMALALAATALAQVVVALIALIAVEHRTPTSPVIGILGLNGIFVASWLVSAWLFRSAATAGLRGN